MRAWPTLEPLALHAHLRAQTEGELAALASPDSLADLRKAAPHELPTERIVGIDLDGVPQEPERLGRLSAEQGIAAHVTP